LTSIVRIDEATIDISSCFAVLRQLLSIRRSVSPAVLQSLVVSLGCHDWTTATPRCTVCPAIRSTDCSQSMNAAARLLLSARKYEHVTPLLRNLYWLRVPERIEFKLAVLVFRCLHGTAPQSCIPGGWAIRHVTDSDSRRRLRSASTSALVVPQTVEWQSATVPFLLQGHVSGTRGSIFCHWLGYCSHLHASLEDVPLCEGLFLKTETS